MESDRASLVQPPVPPLALYVHLPWCVRKCPYCDFNSYALRGPVPERAYVDALLADLDRDLEREGAGSADRRLVSVFLGGGTPSLFPARAVARLLDGVRSRFPAPFDPEVSLEANPGTVERGRFAELRAAGVNRLSIGVQSFQAHLLARIGRIHGRAEALAAAEEAHRAGFSRLNLDLMYGLPGQTRAEARDDLLTACALGPDHVSLYQLTLEPGTPFHRRPPPLPEEDTVWAMQCGAEESLAARGYDRYEVSAYARAGGQCRHNRNYWEFGDYLGIGAGAHGKVTRLPEWRVGRCWKQRRPACYLETASGAHRVAGRSWPGPADLVFEFMMNALRLTGGFASALFEARTGLPFARAAPVLREAADLGLVRLDASCVRTTARGRRFLNEVLVRFLPEGDARDRAGAG